MKTKIAIIFGTGIVLLGGAGLFWILETPSEAPPSNEPAAARPAEPTAAAPVTAPTSAVTKPAAVAAPQPAEPTPAAAPTTGTLIIESDVPETSVFIDRVYLGNAPVTAANLAPGPHRLNMSVTGYEGISEAIDVTADTRTISIKFKEVRLDEQIATVHKHAMGSCAGRLHASPQSLTYETTNKNDGFSTTLTNLDAFEVDYLQKTLKVKIRGGKTYNLTDAEGNVDRLYLFHQAVEKARQRLIAGRD